MKRFFVALAAFILVAAALAQTFPQADISNDLIHARLYLPDPQRGYYQATRFDWSGIVPSLEYQGHQYFGQWFSKYDPKIHDAIMGPVEEFQTGATALGYDEAKPGGSFIRIGVGVLRKPDEPQFRRFNTYEIVDSGEWQVRTHADRVEFRQTLKDGSSGYAYEYTKTLRLVKGKPQMAIEHVLKNVGQKTIVTNVYDHNFLVIDGQTTGPDIHIHFPFKLEATRDLKGLAELRGNELTYLKTFSPTDRVQTELKGFGPDVSDYDIQVENTKTRAGVHIKGDHPLSKVVFWSATSVVAPEPYIDMSIEPGKEFAWRTVYEFYQLP